MSFDDVGSGRIMTLHKKWQIAKILRKENNYVDVFFEKHYGR